MNDSGLIEPTADKGYKLLETLPDAWRCELSPNHYWYYPEGGQPNAFHRFAQRIVLGFKWERINE